LKFKAWNAKAMIGKKTIFFNWNGNVGGILISILSFLIIQFYTRHGGIGISPDSIAYIGVARNLLAHFNFADYNNTPLVDFPVFYPFFLSVLMFICRMDVVQIGSILNGILLAALTLLTSNFLKNTPLKPLYRNLLLLVIAISPALLDIYGMLWSETVFLVLILIFFNALQRYLQAPSVKLLLLAAIPAALACITRYAGVTLIGTGLYLIFFYPKQDFKVKIKHLWVFAFSASSALIINLIRNASVTGLPVGPRERGIVSFQENFGFFSFTIADWLPVFSVSSVVINVVGILISVAFVLILIDNTSKQWRYGSVLHLCSTFIVIYSVFIISMSTITHFEQLNNRFLSPIYVPLVIGLFIGLTTWLQKLHGSRMFSVVIGLLLLFSFMFNEVNISRQMFDEAVNYGVPGYSSDSWKFSSTSSFVKTRKNFFKPGLPIYSNAHEALYFLSGFNARELAHKVDPIDSKQFLNEKVNYLIWYYETADNDLLDSTSIMKKRKVLKEYKFEDGSIFLLKAR
jgi:hypothetical protein